MTHTLVKRLSFWALLALVIGSMLDAGIFSLPATFGRATGSLGAIIAWCITGFGMLMLAFIFQNLARRKPQLDTGIFTYAQTGFGNYIGFLAALGFWAGSCTGMVSYFILIKSALGSFFPFLGEGNTPFAVFFASILLWFFYFLISRGIEQATFVHNIATIAKILIVLVFLGFVIWAFDISVFLDNSWLRARRFLALAIDIEHLQDYGFVGYAAKEMIGEPLETLTSQVKNILLVTAYVFIGIEGASIYSRHAKSRQDVGRATILGFLVVLVLFILVTVLSYGIFPRSTLASLRQPSMAIILGNIVGPYGYLFISFGLLLSILGAYLAWMLFATEILYVAARRNVMPYFLATENKKQVPINALLTTNILIQILLITTLFSDYPYGVLLKLTSSLVLIIYFFVAGYALQLAWKKETYAEDTPIKRIKDMVIAVIAIGYLCLVFWSGGFKYFLLSSLIYTPGSAFFFIARKEQEQIIFSLKEKFLFVFVIVCSCIAIYALHAGKISL